MKKHENNFISMVRAVIAQLKSHEDGALLPVVGEILAELEKRAAEVANKNMILIDTSSGITKEKWKARERMTELALLLAKVGHSYGSLHKDVELAEICNVSYSKLRNMRDIEIRSACSNLIDTVEPYKDNLADYGITEESFADARESIEHFSEQLSKQEVTFATKGAARVDLDSLFAEIRDILVNQLDPVMVVYKSSDKDLYYQYRATRVIKDLGIRHRVEEENTDG